MDGFVELKLTQIPILLNIFEVGRKHASNMYAHAVPAAACHHESRLAVIMLLLMY